MSDDPSVQLLDADPDLAAGLSEDELAVARRQVRVRTRLLGRGAWDPAGMQGPDAGLGLLVLDGVLVREISVRGRCCAEVLGAGDVLRPWGPPEPGDAAVGHAYSWRVLQGARVAELDGRFARVAAQWPSILTAVLVRSLRRVRPVALQYALTQVQGVDVRTHLVLWHLADRWGRVTPDGVILQLPLTHQLLGRLIGARRPSVTAALRRLERDGLANRRADGTWLLRGSPQEVDLQHEPGLR